MHRRRRRPTFHQRRHETQRPAPGFKLSVATFAAGVAAAMVMIGGTPDEPQADTAQTLGAPHVALSIGR